MAVYIRNGGSSTSPYDTWAKALSDIPSTFTRGETYYVADGSYSRRTISTAVSGTTRITIKKATISDHGTDTGWLSSYGDGQAYIGGFEIETSYVTIDGNGDSNGIYGFITYTQWSGTGARPAGIRKAYSVTGNYLTIRWYEYTNDSYDTYKCGVGLYLYNGNNYTIQNCYIHDCFTPIMLINAVTVVVEDSYIARNVSTPLEHSNGIDVHYSSSDITIRYNRFEDIEGTAVLTIIGVAVTQSNWFVYGNIFYWTPAILTRLNGPAHGVFTTNREDTAIHGLYFYNNTIANLPAGIGSCSMKVWIRTPGICSSTYIKNNLWYFGMSGYSSEDAQNSGMVEASYNWYSSGIPCYVESNQQISGSNPFVNWPANNFHLVSETTPGVTLTNTGSHTFTIDPDGVTRGSGGWDRGAYEYTTSGVDSIDPEITITNPTSNTAWSQQASTIGISGTASDNVAVTSVTWSNNLGGSGTATGTTSWTIPAITLYSGDNVITVTAWDAAGNSGTDILTVIYPGTDILYGHAIYIH